MDRIREKFIAEKESTYGGKVDYITFSTFIGSAWMKKKVELNGVLFKVNNNLYFEDFEPRQHPLQFGAPRPDFDKTDFKIDITDIVRTGVISKKNGFKVISENKEIDENDILTGKGLKGFLTGNLAFIKVKSGEIYIFNLFDNFKDLTELNKLI